MPTYAFQCAECKHNFDRFLAMSRRDTPCMEPCPSCGKLAIDKLITAGQVCADGTRILPKALPTGFQEVLAKIHENTPGSNLNQKLSRNPRNWNL